MCALDSNKAKLSALLSNAIIIFKVHYLLYLCHIHCPWHYYRHCSHLHYYYYYYLLNFAADVAAVAVAAVDLMVATDLTFAMAAVSVDVVSYYLNFATE